MLSENWINKTLTIGNVPENKTLYLAFTGTSYIKDIDVIIPACGCMSNIVYDPTTRKLSFMFKTGYVPKHISGNQEINKLITVIYKDRSEDHLYVTGTKIRR